MANKIQDAFDNIKADSQLKDSTKQFLAENRSRKTVLWQRLVFRRAFAVTCVMLLLVMVGAGGYVWIQMPVSYVSIDVNPSIELALNRFDKVISVKAYNDEGRRIIEKLSLKGKKYMDAIDTIVESEDMKIYLTDQSELVFTVAADRSREKALREGVESCSGHIECNSSSYSADISIVSEAHDHMVSLGRYNAYLELSQYDDSITVEECQHMTMSEIHSRIEEHHQKGGHHGEESQSSGDGVYQEEGYYGDGQGYHGRGHH